ncbi:hypothetical protein, partial [Serratia marcescens]|uniref:hypothetical protein n=1 Tax=Serratia marcescens TaxID=615 RepID=UPI0019533C47
VAKETEQGGFDLDRLAQSGLRSGKIISPEAIARSADIRERSERLVERGADALRPAFNETVDAGANAASRAVGALEVLRGFAGIAWRA